MKVFLHIGPDLKAARAFQSALIGQRDWFAEHDVLVPVRLGKRGHWRLHVASLLPGHADPHRSARGLAPDDAHATHTTDMVSRLAQEASGRDWKAIILTAPEIATATVSPAAFDRLVSLLPAPVEDVNVVTQLPNPFDGWTETLARQASQGRVTPPARDPELLRDACSWWARYERSLDDWDADNAGFAARELPPPWIDTDGFLSAWHQRFPQVEAVSSAETRSLTAATRALCVALNLPPLPGAAEDRNVEVRLPSPADLEIRVKENARRAETPVHAVRMVGKAAGKQAEYAAHFDMTPFRTLDSAWRKAVGAHRPLLHNSPPCGNTAKHSSVRSGTTQHSTAPDLGPDAQAAFTAQSHEKFAELVNSGFAPSNKLDTRAIEIEDTPFPRRPRPPNERGKRLIVACMKDEGPYILEWVAHHLEVGFDHFLIYTNDCSDGTSELLDRLQHLGHVTHLDNSQWSGKSPQQAALNRAVESELVRNADWVAHIDVDEFVNIRCGDGTLDDLFAALPDNTTNIAMTWRMFGNAGVQTMRDIPVTRQFTRCAPSFCPKPHTMWGFKTLGRQTGIYAKLSCHRPNKPDVARMEQLHWVNGSGEDMGGEISLRGWRSSVRTAGYGLVQLNHYALRSQDSFLVKRKRGRALHVDRDIGRNYWIRMDWNDHEELSILRHAARTDATMEELRADHTLCRLHADCVDWHQSRAEVLRRDPQLADLVAETARLRFSAAERVAYALSLDHDS